VTNFGEKDSQIKANLAQITEGKRGYLKVEPITQRIRKHWVICTGEISAPIEANGFM
jgi:hypothetical protein